MILYYILLIITLNILICKGEKTFLKAIALSYDDYGLTFNSLVNEFNTYAEEKNLNVELYLDLYTSRNSSLLVDDFGTSIEYLLNRDSTEYDLFFYDVMYSSRYSSYFVDLKDWLPKEHIELYSSGIASQSCKVDDKWVGLPVSVLYDVLYCNMDLLQKYNKDIPKTWDELLEIGKYVRANELFNTDLLIYNGLFPDYETALCSTHEFIYSFRNSKDSPFPEYTSKEAIDALNMLKTIKDELANDDIFKYPELDTTMRLLTGNALFLKFWHFPVNPVYKTIPLVGKKEGVSGSSIGGTNVGINKHISNSQKQLAAEALKFITSKEIQKKLMIKGKLNSAINSLYDDEEVCSVKDCELVKNIQPIARPNPKAVSYSNYSEKFRKYIYQFLFEDDTSASEILSKIENIAKIYEISFNEVSPPVGLITFIIVALIFLMILFTAPFIFIKKFELHFKFLNVDLWIFVLLGLMFQLCILLMDFNEITQSKCRLKFIFWTFGFTFYFIPILYRLIENYPKDKNFMILIKKYKYLFFIFFILIDFCVCYLFTLSPYLPEVKIIENGKNYRICNIYDNKSRKIIYYIGVIEKLTIIICIIILAFHEWDIWRTIKDIRLITSISFINIILYGLYISVKAINNVTYIVSFLLSSVIIIITVLSNYVLIYGIRIFRILINDNADILFIEAISKNSLDAESSSSEMLPPINK